MLFTPHVVTSGSLSKYTKNVLVAFLLGIVLHFALDALPHFDTTDGGLLTIRQLTLVGVDLIIGLTFFLWAVRQGKKLKNNFYWAMFGGIFPDLLDNIPILKDLFRQSTIGKPIHWLHASVQHLDKDMVLGMSFQIIFTLFFLYLLVYSLKKSV